MKMMISRDLLRSKILKDKDLPEEAGFPSAALEDLGMFLPRELTPANDDNIVKLKEAFGTLIRQLRRRDNFSTLELSVAASIEEEEVRQIEHDPHYKPRPRTVHKLAQVFKVQERSLMKLSGATVTMDQGFHDHAVRFAAKSDNMAKLSHSEQKILSEYIKYLTEHGK